MVGIASDITVNVSQNIKENIKGGNMWIWLHC
jgi:hypothetical protein